AAASVVDRFVQPCSDFTYSATACNWSGLSIGQGVISGEPPCLAAPSCTMALMSSTSPAAPLPSTSYLNLLSAKSAGFGFRAADAGPSPLPVVPWQVMQ